MDHQSKIRDRITAVIAVALLAAVCLVPMAASDSDAASLRTYDVNLAKGTTWETEYSYTSTLSPALSIVVSGSAITASTTGWSASVTNGSTVSSGTDAANTVYATAHLDTSNHKVVVSIKVGQSFASANSYVGVRLVTTNPSQTAITAFSVNVLSPSFTTGYTGGSFYDGQTITAQTPVVSAGNNHAYKAVTFSISNGGNGKTLNANTGLTFDTATGKVSGTVSKTTNSQQTYTVTASMTFASGYPASVTFTTPLVIGTYSSASMDAVTVNAINNKTDVSVAAPTTTGISYSLQSAKYTFNGGSQTSITPGTAFNGITVSSAGDVSGKCTVTGTYVITENFKVTQTNQTVSRTVTVKVEDQVTASVASTFNGYVGGLAANTLISTATHGEANQVAGSWSLTQDNGSYFQINSSNGKITVKSVPAAGIYTLTAKYTSSLISANTATAQIKVYVDPNLVLSCSDADKVLYAATSSESLDNGQDSATMSQTATLYAGQKKVAYSITCSTLTVGTDISINSSGKITIADTLSHEKIGDHTVTVTCTDSAVTANTATTTLTVTIVPGMSLGTPTVGRITSS